MQLNNIISDHNWPAPEAGHDPSILTSIYADKVNIAIWQRQHQQMLDAYAEEWINHCPSHTPRLLLSVEKANEQLEKLLPDLHHKNKFQQDIVLLVDMFACLFDTKEVGLRLTPLKKAMCPKFHVDNIPCRLITTYGGLGTEWLLEGNVDRNRLGKGANGLPDHESGILQADKTIQQLSSQHVALLKGSGWLGNEDYGLVHRSPSLSDGQARLLLTLDFS
ncbi:MAG: DUF1826 domain-containing protein [Cellvibrionaceae bacterium]